MNLQGIWVASIAATAALGACSSGTSSGVVSRAGNAPADVVATEDAGSAAKALSDGATLKSSARTSSQWKRNFGEETAALVAAPTATIKRNTSGGLDLTVDGRTLSFSPSDVTVDGYGYQLADGSGGVWTWSADSMAEALDPANTLPVQVFDYYSDNADNTGVNGFAVVGTETKDAAVATLPTATYTGWSRVRIAPTTGFDDYNTKVSEGRGDVTMTADFGAGNVSGTITNIQTRQPNAIDPTRTWTDVSGALALNTAPISGNGFTGGISSDAAFNSNVGTIGSGSSYSGTFFGAAGEEAAGAINLTGTEATSGNPFIAFGVWAAAQ